MVIFWTLTHGSTPVQNTQRILGSVFKTTQDITLENHANQTRITKQQCCCTKLPVIKAENYKLFSSSCRLPPQQHVPHILGLLQDTARQSNSWPVWQSFLEQKLELRWLSETSSNQPFSYFKNSMQFATLTEHYILIYKRTGLVLNNPKSCCLPLMHFTHISMLVFYFYIYIYTYI